MYCLWHALAPLHVAHISFLRVSANEWKFSHSMRKCANSHISCVCVNFIEPQTARGCISLPMSPPPTLWLSSMMKHWRGGLRLQSSILTRGDWMLSKECKLDMTGVVVPNLQRVLGLTTSYTQTYPPASRTGVNFTSLSFKWTSNGCL